MRLSPWLTVLGLALALSLPLPVLAQEPGIYVVQPGDTLTTIARRQNTSVDALIAANGLRNPNQIYIGQRLRLPGAARAAPASPATSGQSHVVQRGETLGLIARRYGTTVRALAALNGLSDPSRIFPGQRLSLTGTQATPSSPAVPASRPPASGTPVRVVVPSIGLDARVVPTGWRTVWSNGQQQSEWIVPDYAAGWHQNSAPVGHAGNTVISGHHNINGEVFRWLVNLNEGDAISLYTADGSALAYRVAQKMILPERDQPPEVRWQNAQWIAPTADTRLTLVTCWPYTDNSHRLIVVAYPTP